MEVINGSRIAEEIRIRIKEEVEAAGLCPNLAIILVGDDKESLVYVGLKDKAISFIGGQTQLVTLDADTSRADLLSQIEKLNKDSKIDGILLQLPLPEPLQPYTNDFLAAIDVNKDVDGFHPVNQGRLFQGQPAFISCAALACREVISQVRGTARGKQAVLVGDSFDLIMPLAVLLIKEGCRVTVIPEMPVKDRLPSADIYVIEKGGPEMVQAEQIKAGSLILDVGFHWHINRVCGNMNRDSLADIEGQLLAVPGGIGPILIAKLVENLWAAAQKKGNS